ncbi:hypothetical protein OPU71_20160 [Niveibacterium sp. 24ML]|uniref:hypothetical protein n=1 Tax=Niveibacterium sp. 24ML TaxID=2985512 RepID=UPI002271F80D|nr:hypothetical protein [Niveibacterium sp. 24ML]MCX9158442.1 hypothetical protein [Niveibacterium sp. 24ML]
MLPQSNEDFRQLADSVNSGGMDGRRGVVERVSASQKAVSEPSPMSKPGVRDSADIVSDSTVIATPVVGVGPGVKKPGQAAPTKTTYSVVVRWEDGSFGIVNQDVDPGLKKGDPVVMNEGRVVRLR